MDSSPHIILLGRLVVARYGAKLSAKRFKPLMTTTARVNSTSSFSLKLPRANIIRYMSQADVPASVSASAARSCSVKKDLSSHRSPSRGLLQIVCFIEALSIRQIITNYAGRVLVCARAANLLFNLNLGISDAD